MKKVLYLIPCPIAENSLDTIPSYVVKTAHALNCFFSENAKTARRTIKLFKHPKPINELVIEQIDKHDDGASDTIFCELLKAHNQIGLLSEAGCPAIADPGSRYVEMARSAGFEIRPLVGPNSILLALMASGLNGQQFTFHGYLPNKAGPLQKKLKQIESEISKNKSTHIFIETPYRNQKLIEYICNKVSAHISLCVAQDLTGDQQSINTMKISKWKSVHTKLDKIPTIFLLG